MSDLFSDIIKSTVDAGLGMISSAWQNKLNKNASEEAFKNQVFGSKELARYQAYDLPEIAMQGYKKAGINPIVAYGGLGSSSMPSMSVSAARQEAPDFGAVFSRATARRELDLRESIAEKEQKRADKLADAKIEDMKEGRRIQERGINSSGVVGLLKYMFGEDSQGKVKELIDKYAQPLFERLLMPKESSSTQQSVSVHDSPLKHFLFHRSVLRASSAKETAERFARMRRYESDLLERRLRESLSKKKK